MNPRGPRFGCRKLHQAQLGRSRQSLIARLVAIVTAAFCFAGGGRAHASSVLAMDLTALTTVADRIVVAEVLSVTSRWETGRRRIVTSVEINVAESWKGSVPSSRRITVLQPGGQVGDIEMKVYGLPLFREGERAVLFLRGGESASTVVGFSEGMRRLTPDPIGKGWSVLGADRTAAVVRSNDGRLVPAPAEPTQGLSELRARVRALVSAP
ncbi:MAG TPA: hypothetical protein VGF45_09435 [Polyangia bacterium]